MKDEILACINSEDIKYLHSGQISKYVFPLSRKEAHLKKTIHLITRFFIISENPKGVILYLVQRRGSKKKPFPLYFTDSSSGHVIWSKNLNLDKIKINAIRELEEEFGIQPEAILGMKFGNLSIEDDEVAYIFFGIIDYRSNITPDPVELDVKDSKFYNRAELEVLLENEKNIESTMKVWRELLNIDAIPFIKEKKIQREIRQEKIILFIGRFQPLHHGHIHVLMSILRSCKFLKIGIGSSQLSNTLNDPFTSEERKRFLHAALDKREIGRKKYKIYEIPDIFNAEKWIDHVISIVGEFDSVFSNSSWVRELFLNKNISIEKKSVIFKKKYNGKNIRNLILKNNKNWKALIPKEVVKLIEEFNGINRIKSFK